MIKKIEDLSYYELLEVSPTATAREIHKAYERIRRVYEPNSVALYSLFTQEESDAICQRIEEAYHTLAYEDDRKLYDAQLRERHELPEPPPLPVAPRYQSPQTRLPFTQPEEDRYESLPPEPEEQKPYVPPAPLQEAVSPVSQLIAEFTGPAIRVFREQKGLALRNIAEITKISVRYLEVIEEENFPKLPARAYVRGFLMLYAKALGCDPERMAGDYLKRYDAAMNPPKK